MAVRRSDKIGPILLGPDVPPPDRSMVYYVPSNKPIEDSERILTPEEWADHLPDVAKNLEGLPRHREGEYMGEFREGRDHEDWEIGITKVDSKTIKQFGDGYRHTRDLMEDTEKQRFNQFCGFCI